MRGGEHRSLLRRFGIEAAAYLDELADTGNKLRIGVSGGETLLEFVNAVPERRRPNVTVYTTALIGRGRLPNSASHIDPLVNAQLLWAKCGRMPGQCEYATVPPYDSTTSRAGVSRELARLTQLKPIEHVLRDMDDINVAFAGIGIIQTPTNDPGQVNRLTALRLLEPLGVTSKDLIAEGAVGEFSYNVFDEQGSGKSSWRFFLSAGHYTGKGDGLSFYRRMVEEKKPVVIIAGTYKEKAIAAALRGKLFNVLFTDEITARTLLKDKGPQDVQMSHETEGDAAI